MKVPGVTPEYQESVRKTKEYLMRLKKGQEMLAESIEKNELLQAQKVIRFWNKVANEMFVEMETATLLHQHILTGNTVMIRPNGTLIKVEELAATTDAIEMDPWLLISMEKLKFVFGDEIHKILEIKDEGNGENES